jgi:hypothetical protein
MLIWLVSYLPFALLFDPRDIRVFLYLSLPSALLVADRASSGSLRRNQIAAGITTVLLFGVNGSTIMERENRPETQRAYQLLQSMNALSQDPGDLFLVGTGTDAAYGLYFGNRKTMPLKPGVTDLSALRSRLTQTRLTGKCVFVENELLLSLLAGKHPDSGVLKEWMNLTPASLPADSDLYGFSALAGCPSPRGIQDAP